MEYNKSNHYMNNTYNKSNNNAIPYNKDMDKLEYAEKIMQNMKNERNSLTTNQMRIILSLFISVRNELEKNIMNDELTEEERYKIKYIKIKLVYQAARTGIQDFIRKSYLEKMIDDVNDRQDFYKLVDYVEALVAFQKYYIGK